MSSPVSRLAAVMALGAIGASVTGACAADLPARLYTKAPLYSAAPAYSWTGLYAGVNLGIGLGRNQTATVSSPPAGAFFPTAYVGPQGAIGGAQLGYNWQRGDWVFGVETDLQASGMRDDLYCTVLCQPGNVFVRYDQRLNWFGTTRARVGLATGPVLSYVTGGFAYGGVQTNLLFGVGAAGFTNFTDETRSGWTYGTGVEASLGGNWTGKIEYLTLNLGTQRGGPLVVTGVTTLTYGSDIREHIFRGGVNYRLGGNAMYSPAPAADWRGFYAGGNAGSALARNRTNYFVTLGGVTENETLRLMPSGFVGGAQAGYNWQSADWVFGVEADLQGSTQRDNRNCNFSCIALIPQTLTVDQRMTWLGTVRGRLGTSIGGSLFYGTAGLAFGNVRNRLVEQLGAFSLDTPFNHTKIGWTAGGGIETPFALFGLFGPNWTAKTEYLYVDLGRVTDSYNLFVPHTVTSHIREHVMRSGLNYHFATPVIAKY